MTALMLAVLLAPAAPAQTAAPAAAAGPEVSTVTVASLYTGDRVRDPFMPGSMGATAPKRQENPNEPLPPVDIHSLQLRGILKDARADFAIFGNDSGRTLLLRGGRLYDEKRKPVKGITGRIIPKQKTVQLRTAEKDVKIFRLGEPTDEKEKRP